MSLALVVMTDGRLDCIKRAIPSMLEHLGEEHVEYAIIHDDSGDREYRAELRRRFGSFTVIGTGQRQGFAGAVRNARNYVSRLDVDHVWWHEDDFLLSRQVDVGAMRRVLDDRGYLAQIALLRQPWNQAERTAGGIIEQHPEDYRLVVDGETAWREHRRFVTTNPALWPRWAFERSWPTGAESEGRFGIQLFKDRAAQCAFWGAEGEWCEHIGHERIGTGY